MEIVNIRLRKPSKYKEKKNMKMEDEGIFAEILCLYSIKKVYVRSDYPKFLFFTFYLKLMTICESKLRRKFVNR